MSYIVLARKWRPQQFPDVLGQEHITKTLSNAIENNRIAHAFLFSGPRGIGKTSAARILAKALCCQETDGPTTTPCGKCHPCVEITEGRSTDIFEIDAASHTGVDNVREIIDNVRYLPSSARFKIYVIDEVHMLSTGAFNALLKTLEEPPEHVKFILATTDVHKVPVTILSRCQRYDFRRIPLMKIAERLSTILEAEGIDHDPNSLALVAREGEGSMRDAQSLIEQVLAFAGGRRLDGALVREALGVVDNALVSSAFHALIERKPGDLIELVGDVYDRGLDLLRFGNALIEHVRDLLVAKLVKNPEGVLDRPKDEIKGLVEMGKKVAPGDLERLFDQLCRVVQDVGFAAHPRFSFEVGLAGIAEQPARVPIDTLMEQLERVESVLSKAPVPTRSTPEQEPRSAPPRSAPARSAPARSAPARSEPARSEPARAKPDAPRKAPQQTAAKIAPGPKGSGFIDFVQVVREKRPSLAATLGQVRPLKFGAEGVELGCDTAFDEDTLTDIETKDYLTKLLADFFGARPTLSIRRAKEGPATISEIDDKKKEARHAEKSEQALSRPAVKAIAEELGGSVAKVRVIDDG